MKIRKNDKAYLQDLKVNIKTDNDIYFQELCLLFDKPSFLNMLFKLRKEYDIVNLLPIDEYREYDIDWFGEGSAKINLSKYTKIESLKKSLPEFYSEIEDSNDFPLILENECYLLCYEFNRPPYFYDVIRQSMYCEMVTDENFHPTKATIVEPSTMWFGVTLPPIAIFVSPTSRDEDVSREFKKAKEMMKTDKRLSYYQPRIDIAPNIRKYREWYWERIKGKTYQKIADEWADKHEVDYTTYLDVLKAVKIYERLLAS